MDRAEKIGLGMAVGGHGLLLLAFALGLLLTTDPINKPAPMQVTIFGEDQVSTAPDAIQEEPAPAEEAAPAAMAQPDIPTVEPEPVPEPVQKTLPKPTPPVVPKTIAKPVPPKPKQPVAKSPSAKSPAFSRGFESTIEGLGKSGTGKAATQPSRTAGTGKAVGTPARKTGAEVRREVNIALGPQIQRFVERCAPSGVEVSAIETTISLNLESSGRLSDVQFIKQTGINDSNRPQAEPLKRCILQAARAASPYRGLDPDYYDVWKSHAMRLRPRS